MDKKVIGISHKLSRNVLVIKKEADNKRERIVSFAMILIIKSNENKILFILNIKYAHLSPIFGLQNIHLVFSTSLYKDKWMYRKPGLKCKFSKLNTFSL